MSREADLYKDKIEVSLDGRQIFYLFFGGAVIVGLVFVLGVMVGRRVEARGHVDRATVAATVDPLAALDRLEGGNGLSFQGSLRGGDAPTSDVEKTIAAMKADAKPDAKADKKSELKPTPVIEPKPEKKDEKKVDEKKAPPAEEKKAEIKKPEQKLETKLEAKAEPKVDAKVEPKVAKVEPKAEVKADAKPVVKPEDAKKPEEAKPAAKFTLQLSSFQDKGEAQTVLDNIKSAGYSAYIAEATVDGKQYFRVRTGSYKSMDAANEAKTELERTTKKSAIVTKL